MPRNRRGHRSTGVVDWLTAILLFAGFLALFASLRQARMYGDGPGLATMHALDTGQTYYNVLYLPACDLLSAWTQGPDPAATPLWLSVLAGALGTGLLFPLIRGLGASRAGALLGALLVGVSPLIVFFATTVEVHALEYLAVVFCGVVTVYAPWNRRGLALACVAVTFPLLYWSHITAVLLGPGWVLLVGLSAQRQGNPFTPRELLFSVGPLLLVTLVGAMAVTNFVSADTWNPFDVSRFVSQIDDNLNPPRASAFLNEGVLQSHFALLPLALIALFRRRLRGIELLFLVGFWVPAFCFYWWWGVIERGAYFVATVPALGWMAARALECDSEGRSRLNRAAAFALVLALAGQAWMALSARARYDVGHDPMERSRVVRSALGGPGLLVSATDLAPDIAIYDAELRQVSLWDQLAKAYLANFSAEAVAPAVRELDPFVAASPVVFDLSYRIPTERVIAKMRKPYFEAIEAELVRRYETREIAHPYWPLLELRPRN